MAPPVILFLMKQCTSVSVYGVYPKDVLGVKPVYHLQKEVLWP